MQTRGFLYRLMSRLVKWTKERDDLFANLPDNPWTYPCCGIHVKASDFFSGSQDLTIPVTVSVPLGNNENT